MSDPRTTERLSVKQTGTVAVITHVSAWSWRCEVCGWLGTGFTSERAAEREGADHVWTEHQVAACFPEQFGGPHDFHHVRGSDSMSKCSRCEWVIGK
jgi:hypothetical protein